MNWDYGEDQDDGYGTEFKKYFDVIIEDDCILIKYFNGGYPSTIHRFANEDVPELLARGVYERFGVAYGFDPDEVKSHILEAMKNSRGV